MNRNDLIEYLRSDLEQKVEALEFLISSTKTSRDADTKSSAGDKHEVGREMAQQELDAQEAQLAKTKELLHRLTKTSTVSRNDQVAFGSLVSTSQGIYFISIGIGRVALHGKQVFCISLASPIGQLLNGQKVGNRIQFNGREIEILKIE